jgi:hypothetical protein
VTPEPPWEWMTRAACKGQTRRFFPADHETGVTRRNIAALVAEFCDRCPVRPECADAGANETAGIWGGIDRDQQRRKAPRR